jgi:hypothetical protein
MFVKAQADGIEFNLAFIPPGFDAPRPAPFDQGYMRALFALGQKLGRAGYPWAKAPPEVAVEARR